MKKYILLVLLVCCFMFSLTGCSKEDKIVGRWQAVAVKVDGEKMTLKQYLEEKNYYDEDELAEAIQDFKNDTTIDFKKDGRGEFEDEKFFWDFDGDNVIVVRLYDEKVKVKIDGEQLVVENPDEDDFYIYYEKVEKK